MFIKLYVMITSLFCAFFLIEVTGYAQHSSVKMPAVNQEAGVEILPQNTDPEIIVIFEKAKQGNAKAQASIGTFYDMGIGLPQDTKKAIYWYEKAANQGIEDAQYTLAILYEFGLGIPENQTKAAFWYTKSALQGNTKAQLVLATMYYEGRGVKEDEKEAKKWLEIAAKKGNSEAKYYLNQMQLSPEEKKLTITDKDYDEGLKKDAADGNWDAQQELKFLSDFKGNSALDQHVISWFEERASQGDVNAQYALGMIYMRGIKVPVDYTKAAKWLGEAVKQGSNGAKYELGMLYVQGKGVKQNIELAKSYFKQVCDTHVKEACEMYEETK
ncbi:tetratricopeptide repeat protein [Commensalibacter papalotli (ex Botero et al. 2024)]|uniref:Sel1 repeat family protein n=1 Tax=Commensalibacter papalotli (ex Botero et al. 2024) TaxID=2972766 RepID=A0ABM9HKS5_9PROT|nr:tetratricopeptide repeat protein [Commensalibacter papalotli (ex Botero et al. 2024)]CAI3929988.1 unnamed protein product [Commensalibacter papalotli (ex Botero et al. 2024)]